MEFILHHPDSNVTSQLTEASLFNQTNDSSILDVWYSHGIMIIGTVGFVTNLVVLLFLLKGIKKKPTSKQYSVCLTLGNAMYSLSTIIGFILKSGFLTRNQATVSLYLFIDHFGYCISEASLILVAVERICAIRFPMFFRKITKQKNVTILIFLVILISLSLTIFPLAVYNGGRMQSSLISLSHYFFSLTILPIVLFVGLSFWAILLLKTRSTGTVLGEATNPRGNGATLRRSKRYLIFIVIMFILCFVPEAVYSVVNMATDGELPMETRIIVDILTESHTLINPLMYWICDPTFREKMSNVTCNCRKFKESARTHPTVNKNTG